MKKISVDTSRSEIVNQCEPDLEDYDKNPYLFNNLNLQLHWKREKGSLHFQSTTHQHTNSLAMLNNSAVFFFNRIFFPQKSLFFFIFLSPFFNLGASEFLYNSLPRYLIYLFFLLDNPHSLKISDKLFQLTRTELFQTMQLFS